MGLTVASIITEFGAYYLNSGQNTNRVLRLLMQPGETEQIMTSIKTDDTIYQMANATISSILQGFQKGWTPKGGVTIIPNKLEQFHFKVDDEIWPDDIEATWLGFLSDDNLDRKNWPLVRYLIEEFYMPKIQADYEQNEIFKGVYQAPTIGTAGANSKGMNGLKKLLVDGVLRGTMNSINLSVLTAANIFDEVEKFVDAISELYQSQKMYVCMSKKWERAYLRDKRSQAFNLQRTNIDKSIDFTPQQVLGLESMKGSDIIFATPKANLIALSKKSANMNKFALESSKRQVYFYTDFWKGVGFGIDQAVWASVPAAERT